MNRVKCWLILATLVVGLGAWGCDKDDAQSGCKKDTDCKGDRVCVDGACGDDDDDKSAAAEDEENEKKRKKKKKKKKKGKKKKGDDGDEASASQGDFAPVDKDAAMARLGPKMKSGTKIAHQVFEGPFGPSPKSLFAVAQLPDASFWVYVMGDDGKNWPAGPMADPEVTMGMEVSAVSFFDANGDGTTDALLMAIYSSHRGKPIFNENVLLKWTSKGMRRLLKLEPKIKRLKSVAEVKKALGV
jgi:hypothetical protein